MQRVTYPTLKQISVTINPTTTTQYEFTRQKPYLLLDIQAPEVSTVQLAPIARANMTCYERAVNKYFPGEFLFDAVKLHPAEKRTITYLDKLHGVFQPDGKYLLNLIILEFDEQ